MTRLLNKIVGVTFLFSFVMTMLFGMIGYESLRLLSFLILLITLFIIYKLSSNKKNNTPPKQDPNGNPNINKNFYDLM